MKNSRASEVVVLVLSVLMISATPSALGVELIGVDFDTGDVYGISLDTAVLTPLGTTGIAGFGSLEFASDGTLYGFTTNLQPGARTLYQLDPLDSYAAHEIGLLNQNSVFDGSLVIAPDGTAYGTNRGDMLAPDLFTIDLGSGVTSPIGTISVDGDTRHDINGMTWRNDGMLVGLDRIENALLAINPADATAEIIAYVTPDAGGVGGMAVWGDTGYFATAGPDAIPGGSNELYTFNLFTGHHELVGSFDDTITEGSGISGLAIIPEPASLFLVAVGGLVFLRRRWSQS